VKHKQALIAFLTPCLPAAIALAIALVFAPSIVARHLLQNRLQAAGIHAEIGDIDADLFSGQVSLDNLHGRDAKGRLFRIGHLAIGLDYQAFTEHRIDLSSATLANAYVTVGRNRDHQLTILGLPLPTGASGGKQSNWGFGINKVTVSNLTVHYATSPQSDRPGSDEHFQLDRLKIGRLATWQPDRPTPFQMRLHLPPGTLRLNGRFTPLGAPLAGHGHLQAEDLPMGALAPFAGRDALTLLAGTLTANQTLDFQYNAGGGLDFTLAGHSRWRAARFATKSGMAMKAADLVWNGQETAHLLRGRGQAGRATINGRAKLVGAAAHRPGQFAFSQHSAQWQGKAHALFEHDRTQINTQGQLRGQRIRLGSPGQLRLASAAVQQSGDLDLTFTAEETRIDTHGGLKTDGLALTVPDTLSLAGQAIDWQGKSTTHLTAGGTHVHTDGKLRADSLTLSIPEATDISADHVNWQGRAQMDDARLFSRTADGHLLADGVRVAISGKPLQLTANRIGFNGRYAMQPAGRGNALTLNVHGSAFSDAFAATNTTIDAPWFSAMQASASGIDINGLDAIDLARVEATGIRFLQDPGSGPAVVQAVAMHAQKFSLHDFRHYRVADLGMRNTMIHIHHGKHGLHVFSEFLGRAGKARKQKPKRTPQKNRTQTTTYAIGQLHLSGPAITFIDSATTPAVRINGSQLDFKLADLDTADRRQTMNYKLSLDVGAYGHFDSLGTVTPRAPGGLNMDIKAWLRSLALRPLSGYLNAAMDRRIAGGAADGTLKLTAAQGQLDGVLDTTVTNFRLRNDTGTKTPIALGISMATALKLLRGHDDIIHFRTKVLGNLTAPYFSLNNLIREAVLAGLHTALMSDFSPIGLLNRAKNAFLNLFRSIKDYPAVFTPGHHYIPSRDRRLLALIAQALRQHPDWTLHMRGQATPADAEALGLAGLSSQARRKRLQKLAYQRQQAVRDYMAARNVIPSRIIGGEPVVSQSDHAKPMVSFSLDKD
jgi:hypothetical protein